MSWRDGLGVGLHYDFHARPDDREIGAFGVEELVAMWRRVRPDWVQCDTKGHTGYASYPSRIGPHPEVMPGDALRSYREASRRLGLPLVSHFLTLYDRSAGLHEEWARRDEQGRTSFHLCVNSGYRDERLIPQLLEVVDEYDVDGFWLDSDAWRAAPCYCDTCQALFRTQAGVRSVPRHEGEEGWDAWLAFHRASHERHVRAIVDAVHARKAGCLVTVNWAYTLMQPDEIAAPVDTLSGDLAHNHILDWHECEARFLDRRGLPWDLQQWAFTLAGAAGDLELRSTDQLCQGGAITLASGGAAAYYLQPLRSGLPVPWQQEVMAEVVKFCRRRVPHCIGTESVPVTAVLHGVESHHRATERLAVSPEVGLYTSAERTASVKGAVLGLLDLHHHVDVITERGLRERAGEYALIVVPEPRALAPEVLADLDAYVRGGGRLLLTGADAGELAGDLSGLAAGGEVVADARWVEADGRATGLPGPWRLARPTTAATLRPLLRHQDPATGTTEDPAITVNEVGAGRVATVPGPLFACLYANRLEWRRRLVELAVEALAPDIPLSVDAPPSVHVTLRRRAGTLYLNLVNTAADPPPSPRKLDVERVPETGPVTIRLWLPRPPAAVRLEPDGRLEHRWRDGALEVIVSRLHIHAIVAIDPALNSTD